MRISPIVLATLLLCSAESHAQSRLMQPADLFRIERIGAITWSPDRSKAAVEVHRPGRWVDAGIPTADIVVIDVATGSRETVSRWSDDILGFFRPAWSPDGSRLLFLSVDSTAAIRPWIWSPGESAAALGRWTLTEGLADPPAAFWRDTDHVVMMIGDSGYVKNGPIYSRIHRARNSADIWREARDARNATVTVLDGSAPGIDSTDGAESRTRIIAVNVRTNAATTLASGALHAPRISPDRRTISYRFEDPPVPASRVDTFFGPEARGDDAYDPVNWGRGVRHIDAATGREVSAPSTAQPAPPVPAGSRPALRTLLNDSAGTSLVLSRPGKQDTVVWQGNAWVRNVRGGKPQAISYRSTKGTALTGWVLYPPGHDGKSRLPVVIGVYPGNTYGEDVPGPFSVLNPNFQHPQLFAALGYAFVLPTMPVSDTMFHGDAIAELMDGLMPLLDTLVQRGIAAPDRMALLGQSAGGWATLGLITRTTRFRSAIASASYSNLESLYGTFYGLYRYGDSGHPMRGVLLRMLQLERGYFAVGAAPWEKPERYRLNSPIHGAANVRTPLLMIHGEVDFIPVQQAEEMFTSLYRQDKRVSLIRYAGESHTITARANVLDMWKRIDAWLQETMAP